MSTVLPRSWRSVRALSFAVMNEALADWQTPRRATTQPRVKTKPRARLAFTTNRRLSSLSTASAQP